MSVPQGPNPSGLCMCGCGAKTHLATRTRPTRGDVRGQPVRYVKAHNTYPPVPQYIVDPTSGCWVWQRTTDASGYGQMRANRQTAYAHRVFWEREHGRIPGGLQLDHLCRNRRCVNPDHMELVTTRENTRRGANARLSADVAARLRKLRAGGMSIRALADLFGISQSHTGKIARGESWREDPVDG
jgi:hypothetical protein